MTKVCNDILIVMFVKLTFDTILLGDLRIARDSTMPTAHFESILLVLLKEWCQLVCSFYDVQVCNLSLMSA